MYNLLISAGTAVLAFVILYLVAGLSLWISLPLSLVVFAGAFYSLSRFIMKKVMDIAEIAGKDLQAQRVDKAIKVLQSGLQYGKWQIYVEGQINSQIGTIYYMKREFNTAFPYLEKSFFKNWVAMGMLAVTYMKKNRKDKMVQTFEKAVQGTPKEALLWNLYAYCLVETGDNEKAIQVLEKGLKKIPGDDRLTGNLELVREGKKMKMKNYGEMWLQFHLERPGAIMKQQAAAMGGMRRRVIRK